jgi:hypothetical protein
MADLKNTLQSMFDVLKGVEERARKLKNQNLADIAASAHGRVKQLIDHPDTELVDERKDQAHEGNPLYVAPATKDEAIARMRKEGDVDPEGTAKINWPHLFDSSVPARDSTPFREAGTRPQQPFPQA